MKASLWKAWFNVGDNTLTLKPSSPMFDASEHKPNEMVQAYWTAPGGYDGFLARACKETGLEIIEWDSHYTLQFLVVMEGYTVKQAQAKLSRFVAKHFALWRAE